MICSAVRSNVSMRWAGFSGLDLEGRGAATALLLEDPLGLADGRERLGITRLELPLVPLQHRVSTGRQHSQFCHLVPSFVAAVHGNTQPAQMDRAGVESRLLSGAGTRGYTESDDDGQSLDRGPATGRLTGY